MHAHLPLSSTLGCYARLSLRYVQAEYYYVVTEEVGGGELFERICDKETYTEHEARQLVKTLLQTLAFLHSKQVSCETYIHTTSARETN